MRHHHSHWFQSYIYLINLIYHLAKLNIYCLLMDNYRHKNNTAGCPGTQEPVLPHQAYELVNHHRHAAARPDHGGDGVLFPTRVPGVRRHRLYVIVQRRHPRSF